MGFIDVIELPLYSDKRVHKIETLKSFIDKSASFALTAEEEADGDDVLF